MKKVSYLFVLLFFFFSAAIPMLAQQQTDEEAYSIAVDNQGNAYVLGYSPVGYITIKYDSNGNMKWIAPFPSARYAQKITLDAAGNIYITGNNGDDIVTVKYDNNGLTQWTAYFNGPGNSRDTAYDIAVDSSGNVYVTGFTQLGNTYNYVTIKYDANGYRLWAAIHESVGTSYGRANALALGQDGSVYVTGSSDEDYLTIKYDPDGNEAWLARYEGAGYIDWAFDIAVDSEGNSYVTGRSDRDYTHNTDYATVKYDINGDQVWVERYTGSIYSAVGLKIAIDEYTVPGEVQVYVTGYSDFPNRGFDFATIKYDADGRRQWVATYDSPGGNPPTYPIHDQPTDLVLDPSGNIIVSGCSLKYLSPLLQTNVDYLTVKYDAEGNQLWAARYDGPGNGEDIGFAVATDSQGDVYVTGMSFGQDTGPDFYTIKYEPDGGTIWGARYWGQPLNQPPVAEAGPDKILNVGQLSLFDGSASSDPDGTISSYAWDFGDGATARGVTAYHAYSSKGNFTVTLTVTDDKGATATDTLVAKVVNYPPVANAGPDLTVIACESASFNGGRSYDSDGTIAGYQWNFGDGSTALGVLVSHVYRFPGSYTVMLTVTDNAGATATDTAAVTVKSIAGAIQILVDLVSGFNLQQGIDNSLDAKLQRAVDAQTAANANQRQDALSHIQAFINEVNAQRGKALSVEQADQLLFWAQRIITVISTVGC